MDGGETLDSLLYECTKTTNQAVDPDTVDKFCKAVDNDLDGPSTAARLLGHKIQSPQQQESLNALCVTDECVRKCGRRFQDEIGKFRFLNEIIKMISPKYFGDKTASAVKTKCIELLYRWSLDLRHEPKILDAYEMLKRQGIIDDDPILGEADQNGTAPDQVNGTQQNGAEGSPPADNPAQQHSIFTDEDKSKLLAKLLRSKHPDDLQAANRLIKNMVKQDEEKQEKRSQRYNLLETVKNNVKLLNEMLDCYQMSGGSSMSDKDIIKELFKNIECERPKLFKLASDTEDKDSQGMSQVLEVNDEVVQIAQRYKQVIEQGEASDKNKSEAAKNMSDDLAGLDLGGSSQTEDLFSGFEGATPASTTTKSILDLFGSNPTTVSSTTTPTLLTTMNTQHVPPVQPTATPVLPIFNSAPAAAPAPVSTTSNLDDIFSFGASASNTVPSASSTLAPVTQTASLTDDIGLLSLDSSAVGTAGLAAPLMPSNDSVSLFDTAAGDASDNLFDNGKKSALEDLDFLGQDLLQKTKPDQQSMPVVAPVAAAPAKRSLNQLKATGVEQNLNVSVPAAAAVAAPVTPLLPLTNIHVPLDAVKPGDLPPLTVYDKESIKLVIHFALNKPRDDVYVMVISITSSKPQPIKSVIFQAAVPKSMKVKLQPPSGTELPAFNPILPPSAVTQIMLLANPSKEKVKLKYKLSYMLNGTPVSDTGDVTDFPF